MVPQAELILRVITLGFLVSSHFLETVWVPLNMLHILKIDFVSNFGFKFGVTYIEIMFSKFGFKYGMIWYQIFFSNFGFKFVSILDQMKYNFGFIFGLQILYPFGYKICIQILVANIG